MSSTAASAAGLCDSCRYQRVISNTRGSRFSLCERSKTDPAFPRYPRLPVRSCSGYEKRADQARPPTVSPNEET
jgi:hypothetical protein